MIGKPVPHTTSCLAILLTLGTAGLSPAVAATLGVASSNPNPQPARLAELFQILDVAEDIDDVLDGDFGQVDPVRNVTESIEDGLDDVNDTITDVTHINIIEPFTKVDDEVEDFADDVDDAIRHVSNDVNDWFN
ncbi:MAG: hypothetical protein ACFCVD_23660 [Nodosilinea sp.]